VKTKLTLTFLLVVTILLLIFVAIKTIGNPFKINTNHTAVIKEMRALNRLETASFTIEKIIDGGTQGNRLQTFLFGDKILLIAHGNVIGGFDFSKLSDKDFVIKDKTIQINLPAPEILVATLDNSQTRVYDRQRGILALSEKDLESEARQTAEKSIREAACSAGILNQAAENGRKQLTAFLGALGFTQITLNIPTGKC
jgi:hypothetical protein